MRAHCRCAFVDVRCFRATEPEQGPGLKPWTCCQYSSRNQTPPVALIDALVPVEVSLNSHLGTSTLQVAASDADMAHSFDDNIARSMQNGQIVAAIMPARMQTQPVMLARQSHLGQETFAILAAMWLFIH